jgi:hypothetical protein
MLEVAVWAGEPAWIARAFPLTVDGLVLAALRRGRQGRWWLALGIAVSVAANMLARYPDLAATAGPVVSAWPPLALFGTPPTPARPEDGTMSGAWGQLAREHWQHYLPARYAALEDPDRFFDALDDEATAYYAAIRDGMLEGINPNNGTISWAEFLQRIAWANQTAREIVGVELIFIPGEESDEAE